MLDLLNRKDKDTEHQVAIDLCMAADPDISVVAVVMQACVDPFDIRAFVVADQPSIPVVGPALRLRFLLQACLSAVSRRGSCRRSRYGRCAHCMSGFSARHRQRPSTRTGMSPAARSAPPSGSRPDCRAVTPRSEDLQAECHLPPHRCAACSRSTISCVPSRSASSPVALRWQIGDHHRQINVQLPVEPLLFL